MFGVVDKAASASLSAVACRKRTADLMAAAMMYEPSYRCMRREFAVLGMHAGCVERADELRTRGFLDDSTRRMSLFVAGELWLDRCGASDGRGTLNCAIDAYDRTPHLFPAAVRGLCSGLLVDEARGRSVLFNDRLGMERLFVYEDEDRYVFASEAKAILAAVPATRRFDREGLAEFLATGCTFGERSLFTGIRVLPASTAVHFSPGSAKARRYFDPATWEDPEPLSEPDFLDALAVTVDAAVRNDLAPGSTALSLTGGLDSRMILAAANPLDRAVPCYTFGSMYRETYDVRVARAIARTCNQPHHVLVLDDAFVRSAGDWLEKSIYISDGYLGLSGAAELYLNRAARQIAPVRVTGNYGGELLRGVRAFKGSMPGGDFLTPDMTGHVRAAIDAFGSLNQMPPLSFTLLRQAPSGYGRYAIERSQLTVRSPFLDDRVVEVLYRRPRQMAPATDPSVFLVGRRRPDLLGIPTDRGLLGGGGRLRRRALRVYREALFKAEYLTGHGAPHGVAQMTRRPPGRLLERMFVGRHKFLHPRIWMRGSLGEYVQSVLAEAEGALDAICEPGTVRRVLQDHRNGSRNYWEELDKLLTISAAHRLLLRPGACLP